MKKKITTRSAKDKGMRLQKQVCQKISESISIPWGTEDDDLIRPRPANIKGVDIILINEAKDLFAYSTECKWQERWDIHDAIKQAKKNKKENTDWLLFMKRSNEDPIAILDINAFFNLIKRIGESNV